MRVITIEAQMISRRPPKTYLVVWPDCCRNRIMFLSLQEYRDEYPIINEAPRRAATLVPLELHQGGAKALVGALSIPPEFGY
jgi:hypothetical protein